MSEETKRLIEFSKWVTKMRHDDEIYNKVNDALVKIHERYLGSAYNVNSALVHKIGDAIIDGKISFTKAIKEYKTKFQND